jgi:hypothetical protein
MKSTIHIAFRCGDTHIERSADIDMPEWDPLFYTDRIYDDRISDVIRSTVKALMCEPVDTRSRSGVN